MGNSKWRRLLSKHATTALHITLTALVTCVLGACARAPERSTELVLAAASSMRYPLDEIIERFENETGYAVLLSLGSSGSFFAQISNGAPYDVYIAADMNYPRQLARADLIEPGSLEVYGTGGIALWVTAGSPVDVERLQMDALLDPDVRRVSIANPTLAPYGAAALEAMEAAGVYDQVLGRIVRAENVAQAAQFVAAGAADIGILAMSQVRSPAMPAGRYWEVPARLHSPIEQGMVILARARQAGHYEAARAFVEMLGSPVGVSILEDHGFSVP